MSNRSTSNSESTAEQVTDAYQAWIDSTEALKNTDASEEDFNNVAAIASSQSLMALQTLTAYKGPVHPDWRENIKALSDQAVANASNARRLRKTPSE